MTRGSDADRSRMRAQTLHRSAQGLSTAAYIAWITLRDHPGLTSALAIADGPCRISSLDETRIDAGLRELDRLGLARQHDARAVGGWHLTQAGRELG